MGIRRRRRKLSTLMSRLDQRVKSVELRPVSLLTSGEIGDAIDSGELLSPPESFVGPSAPNQFHKIEDAYIYPKSLGLPEDRVEIYLEVDLKVVRGEILEIRGIYGTQNHDIDVDGQNFAVKSLDTPPWDGRGLPKDQTKDDPTNDQRPLVTITNAYSVTPETQAPQTWNTFYRLQTKRAVDSYSILGTTVTLTMNAVHKFKAGDVVFVDMFAEDSRAFGDDGLFKITSVTTNTIVYTLAAGVDEPTGVVELDPLSVHVFPVARKFASVGSTWTNTSDNTIYYWDGIRWVTWSAGSVEPDDDPPAAPTNLVITSKGTVSTNVSFPTASVTLTWAAPTLNASGSPITDLVGYHIKWRRTPSETWKIKDVPIKDATSYTFDGDAIFEQGKLYYFELYAYDSGSLLSEPATGTHTTEIKTTTLSDAAPTAPIIESRLGTMTVRWDGLLATTPPTNPPLDVLYLKIHRSLVNNFTPSDSTLVSTISAVANNYSVFSDLAYGSDYYFRFVLIDTSGVQSKISAQVVARVTPLVDVDLLVSNVLNSWSFAGNLISAGDLANGTINASSLFGPNVIVQNAIAANAIGANQIAAGSIIAGKIGANAITANVMAANSISAGAIQANAIEADKINVGALDGKLITGSTIRTSNNAARVEMNNTGLYAYNSGGAITFRALSSDGSVFIASGVQIGGYATNLELSTVSGTANNAANTAANASSTANSAANAASTANTAVNGVITNIYTPGTTTINGGRITTNTITATQIAANTITATQIAANTVTAAQINTGYVYAGNINATQITAGVITGRSLQTAATGRRVVISSSTENIRFYNDSGIESGTIIATGNVATQGFSITGAGTAAMNIGSVTTVFTGSISTGGTSNIFAAGRLGQNTWTGTPFRTISADTSGNIVPGTPSDIRLKKNIFSINNALSQINNLNPVTYNWNEEEDTSPKHPGLIAQEVGQIFDTSKISIVNKILNVGESPDDYPDAILGVETIKIVPYLIKAVQELSQKNDELQARLATLEGTT